MIRFSLGVALVLVYVSFAVCDLLTKRYDTALISLLLAGVNGLIYFGH